MHLWSTEPAKQSTYTHLPSRNRNHPRRHTTTSRSAPPKKSSFFLVFRRSQMPVVFNIVRASIYTAVLLWSVICLAIAIHFNALLTTNDLTRFIPFVIFVCSATLAIILALLLFGVKKANPISARVELGCLGLAGIIWLVLAAILITSNAEDADVECYSNDSSAGSVLIDVPGFSTETYRAQYRVLEAFSLFNVILIWVFLLFVLFLALRDHFRGERHVWFTPVTAYPWLYRNQAQEKEKELKLPPPVTAPVDRSRSRGGGALTEVREKSRDRRARGRQSSRDRRQQQPQPQPQQHRYTYRHGYLIPQAPHAPPKASGGTGRSRAERSRTRDYRHDRYHRDASPRR